MDIGKKGARSVTATIGRQEFTLGDGRLMASPDWGNTSRTYDALRVTGTLPGVKIDVFGAGVVDVNPNGFHRAKQGERSYGTWATFDKVPYFKTFDAYLVAKANRLVTGELGSKGNARTYTVGARVGGPIGKRLAWEVGGAGQRGHYADDDLSAWATHESLAYTVGASTMKPRLVFEHVFASGDENAKDGTKSTFDQLSPSNHIKYGLADWWDGATCTPWP